VAMATTQGHASQYIKIDVCFVLLPHRDLGNHGASRGQGVSSEIPQ
jgi:hypothetical protein